MTSGPFILIENLYDRKISVQMNKNSLTNKKFVTIINNHIYQRYTNLCTRKGLLLGIFWKTK